MTRKRPRDDCDDDEEGRKPMNKKSVLVMNQKGRKNEEKGVTKGKFPSKGIRGKKRRMFVRV